jgi:hypothetical protein
MAADETTQLLARQTPEERDGNTTAAGKPGKPFALWQIGALCGKRQFKLIS